MFWESAWQKAGLTGFLQIAIVKTLPGDEILSSRHDQNFTAEIEGTAFEFNSMYTIKLQLFQVTYFLREKEPGSIC